MASLSLMPPGRLSGRGAIFARLPSHCNPYIGNGDQATLSSRSGVNVSLV